MVIRNILLTGSTGYIGRRLQEKLIKDPHVRLRLLVRNEKKVPVSVKNRAEITEANTLQEETLRGAFDGIDTAYYLIHSMGSTGDFAELDRRSASNFRDACIAAKVKRIIYLGGLGDKHTASKHLHSRIETGEILSAKPAQIQTLWLRAGIIIGSGSASFEIIRNIVQKLPFMITPKWVKTRTQPIGITDVLEYLYQAKDLREKDNLTIDIGSEVMSFKEMLITAAEVMGLKRFIIPVPILSPRTSSYWLILFTPVQYRIARSLIDGLKSETIAANDNARKFFPSISPLPYEKTVALALFEIINNQVLSRWCDSSAQEECDIKGKDSISKAVLIDRREFPFDRAIHREVFQSALSVGGEKGWFRHNGLWRLRGFMDRIAGGPGIIRGRRDPSSLRLGDSLDFWKVADIEPDKRLLLFSQMKLPGKAWLEFFVESALLIQTSYFLPKGLWGRIYWYTTLPFHNIVFNDLGKSIIKRAENL
ncbi:MAG: SDR family oxidoreductase [Candidatus Aminicenantes bacterium]|nr:SDR family oxidoreductase [Candidatus Aminicenantes bacterium]